MGCRLVFLSRMVEALFQRSQIDRHLPSCLAVHREGHKEPTDAVALEVEGDRQVRAGIGARLDRNVDHGSDWTIHTTDAPAVRRIEADELSGVGSVGEADAPRPETAVPDLGGADVVRLAADDTLLPLREATRIGGVGEHLLSRAVDLDADSDWRHSAMPRDEVRVARQIERPSRITIDALVNRLPARSVAIEVTVLELRASPFRRLCDKPDLDLVGVALVRLELPLRADVPAEDDPIGRFIGEDSSVCG